MNVAICDDERIFLQTLKKNILEFTADSSDEVSIDEFTGGEELLAGFSRSKYDIIIIDIEMNGINGMETAKAIRELDDNVIIAFLTSYEDFAIQGYFVNAVRYILKQQPDAMYRNQLRSIFDEYNQKNKVFRYVVRGKAFSARLSEINYFEVFNRIIIVHTDNTTFEYYGRIFDLEAEYIKDGFVRTGKSYLINISHIKYIDNKEIIMKNGFKIKISRRLREQVTELYLNYLSGR